MQAARNLDPIGDLETAGRHGLESARVTIQSPLGVLVQLRPAPKAPDRA